MSPSSVAMPSGASASVTARACSSEASVTPSVGSSFRSRHGSSLSLAERKVETWSPCSSDGSGLGRGFIVYTIFFAGIEVVAPYVRAQSDLFNANVSVTTRKRLTGAILVVALGLVHLPRRSLDDRNRW